MPYPCCLARLAFGSQIPEIAFGTWKVPQDVTSGEVTTAFDVGFDHIDTAQVYANEEQVGQALAQGEVKRKSYWLTTKWSGVGGKGPRQSCEESLAKVSLELRGGGDRRSMRAFARSSASTTSTCT